MIFAILKVWLMLPLHCIIVKIIVKKLKQFTTPFKDDIHQLTDLKQQIPQRWYYFAAHLQNVTVLRSNIIFMIFAVLGLPVGGCRP